MKKSIHKTHTPLVRIFVIVGALLLLAPFPAAAAATTVYLTSGTSWTVPTDWDSSSNSIECIGAGGNGGNGGTATNPGSGGGGGAYAKITNLSLTPNASVSYVVATGGSGNDTYFNGAASTTASLSCAPGKNGTIGAGVAGGAGGLASNSTGSITYGGGNGATAPTNRTGSAGGGAAGPSGAGKDGGVGNSNSSSAAGGGGSNGGSSTAGENGPGGGTGGNGGAGTGGTGGGAGSSSLGGDGSSGGGGGGAGGTNADPAAIAGGNGGSDTAFDATHGAGGGGGSGSGSAITGAGGNGGAGGLYGGGGGGAGTAPTTAGTGGSGAQGIIVITYAVDTEVIRTIRLFSSIKLYNGKLVIYPTQNASPQITFVDSAGSTAATITIPATAQVGDVAVLFDYARSGSLPADVIPTNWTVLTQFAGTVTRLNASYKIIQAGEPGSIVTGLDGTTADNKVMQVFRGNTAIISVTAEDWASELSATDPAAQTVNATNQTVPLILLGMALSEPGTAAFSTESPAFDATTANSNNDMLVGYKLYNSSPGDHSLDVNDLTTVDGLASGYLEVSF